MRESSENPGLHGYDIIKSKVTQFNFETEPTQAHASLGENYPTDSLFLLKTETIWRSPSEFAVSSWATLECALGTAVNEWSFPMLWSKVLSCKISIQNFSEATQ